MGGTNRSPVTAPKPEASSPDAAPTKAPKAAKKPATPRVRKPPTPKVPPRYKYVWSVGVPGGAATVYGYAERAAADTESARRGKGCIVLQAKVLMEPLPKVE